MHRFSLCQGFSPLFQDNICPKSSKHKNSTIRLPSWQEPVINTSSAQKREMETASLKNSSSAACYKHGWVSQTISSQLAGTVICEILGRLKQCGRLSGLSILPTSLKRLEQEGCKGIAANSIIKKNDMRNLLVIIVPSEKEELIKCWKHQLEVDKLSYSEELNMELWAHFPVRAHAPPPLQLRVHGATKSRENTWGQKLAEFGLRTNNLSSCWLSLLLCLYRECKPFTLVTILSCSC